MNSIKFIWDDQKNRYNLKKHTVSFEESQTVFFDENALEFFDPEHSEEENRIYYVRHELSSAYSRSMLLLQER